MMTPTPARSAWRLTAMRSRAHRSIRCSHSTAGAGGSRRGKSMHVGSTAALVIAAGLITGTAFAQPAPESHATAQRDSPGAGANFPDRPRRANHACHQLSAAERRDESRFRPARRCCQTPWARRRSKVRRDTSLSTRDLTNWNRPLASVRNISHMCSGRHT